ncbi:MAG: hypothetical protein IJT19_01715 [Bacteroidaceae bacterium]|nr:hypothetical protein [Bacteroidaceae bacterium]
MKKQIKIIASIVVLALFYVAAISSGSSQNAVQSGTEKALITSGNHNGYDSASGKE